MTAYGSAENAVEALKRSGAFDYLTKPVDLKQFRSSGGLGQCKAGGGVPRPPGRPQPRAATPTGARRRNMRRAMRRWQQAGRRHRRPSATGQAAGGQGLAGHGAGSHAHGESGTGKELVAQAHACQQPAGRRPPGGRELRRHSGERCLKPNFLAPARARTPAPPRTGTGYFPGRTRAAPCSWTKSAICPWPCSPSCCGPSRSASVRPLGSTQEETRWMCAS